MINEWTTLFVYPRKAIQLRQKKTREAMAFMIDFWLPTRRNICTLCILFFLISMLATPTLWHVECNFYWRCSGISTGHQSAVFILQEPNSICIHAPLSIYHWGQRVWEWVKAMLAATGIACCPRPPLFTFPSAETMLRDLAYLKRSGSIRFSIPLDHNLTFLYGFAPM